VEKKSLFLRPPPSSLGGAGGVLHGATAAAAMARPLLLPLLLRRPDDSSTTFLIILQIEFVLILFSLVNAAFCQPAQLHQPTRMLLTKQLKLSDETLFTITTELELGCNNCLHHL